MIEFIPKLWNRFALCLANVVYNSTGEYVDDYTIYIKFYEGRKLFKKKHKVRHLKKIWDPLPPKHIREWALQFNYKINVTNSINAGGYVGTIKNVLHNDDGPAAINYDIDGKTMLSQEWHHNGIHYDIDELAEYIALSDADKVELKLLGA